MYLVSKAELVYTIRQFDLLNPSCSQRVLYNQSMQKSQHDRHAKDREFVVGEQVMVCNLRPGPKWVVGIVREKTGPLSYVVETDYKQVWRRHVVHLKNFGDVNVTEPNDGELESDSPTEDTECEGDDVVEPPESGDQNNSTVDESPRRYPTCTRN